MWKPFSPYSDFYEVSIVRGEGKLVSRHLFISPFSYTSAFTVYKHIEYASEGHIVITRMKISYPLGPGAGMAARGFQDGSGKYFCRELGVNIWWRRKATEEIAICPMDDSQDGDKTESVESSSLGVDGQ